MTRSTITAQPRPYPRVPKDIEAIWQRMAGSKGDLSEKDFLKVASWAYRAMPAENHPSAFFDLYMHVMRPEKARHGD